VNHSEFVFFGSFLVVIVAILLFDLGVFNRKSHVIHFKEALFWTIVWISLGVGFYFFLLFKGDLIHGADSVERIRELILLHRHPIQVEDNLLAAQKLYKANLALEYITGYLIEKALSVDNVFVMIMIFYSFGVREKYYKWVLFWGILGAIVMRFIFIFGSAALIYRFEWILYVFGGFLIITAWLMYRKRNKEAKIEPGRHPVVKFARKYFAVYPRDVGHRFFIRDHKGKVFITPLFIVLLVIEFTDVIFAVDSIPAIFAITKDPYIVFYSNIFAIIGLRSLFFLVMHVMNTFRYLKTGLSVLLGFIGIKMILHDFLTGAGFKTVHSLIIVGGILLISIVASLLFPGKKAKEENKTGA
jgi:tellurite resistance protein TerC